MLDPNNYETDGPTEYGWGAGIFPPGIADTDGPDFGEPYPEMGLTSGKDTNFDNYARAVADRRTDPTNPESNRDFNVLGNVDRFGASPPLVRESAPDIESSVEPVTPNKTPRRW